MKYSAAEWAEKRKKGIERYLMFDGILLAGGPFAVVMQIIAVLFARDEGQTIGQYLTASQTWMTFFALATLFGLVIGFINWRPNEKAVAGGADNL